MVAPLGGCATTNPARPVLPFALNANSSLGVMIGGQKQLGAHKPVIQTEDRRCEMWCPDNSAVIDAALYYFRRDTFL